MVKTLYSVRGICSTQCPYLAEGKVELILCLLGLRHRRLCGVRGGQDLVAVVLQRPQQLLILPHRLHLRALLGVSLHGAWKFDVNERS